MAIHRGADINGPVVAELNKRQGHSKSLCDVYVSLKAADGRSTMQEIPVQSTSGQMWRISPKFHSDSQMACQSSRKSLAYTEASRCAKYVRARGELFEADEPVQARTPDDRLVAGEKRSSFCEMELYICAVRCLLWSLTEPSMLTRTTLAIGPRPAVRGVACLSVHPEENVTRGYTGRKESLISDRLYEQAGCASMPTIKRRWLPSLAAPVAPPP